MQVEHLLNLLNYLKIRMRLLKRFHGAFQGVILAVNWMFIYVSILLQDCHGNLNITKSLGKQ